MSVTAVTTKDVVYLIDYDIPQKPAAGRVAFYRNLSKLKRNYGYDGESTASVVKTKDRELAFKIHDLAVAYGGQCNVWKAINICKDSREGQR